MASDLQVKTSPRPQSRLALEVLVPVQRCQRSYDKAMRKLCRTVRLPGFRPGRVPQAAVLQQLGARHVWITALEELLEETARDVLNRQDLDLVGKLQLQDSFDALAQQFNPGESLTVNMEADVRPTAALTAYRDLEVEVEEDSVEDGLEETLQKLRRSASTKVPLERTTAARGDVAVIRFVQTPPADSGEGGQASEDEGEEGEGQSSPTPGTMEIEVDLMEEYALVPEMVNTVIGMKVGETRAILPISISNGAEEEDETGSTAAQDGDSDSSDTLSFPLSVTLRGLKELQAPELDDAFAQKVSHFDTMAELRDALRRKVEEEVRENNRESRQDALIQAVCEGMTVDLPQSMVEQEMEAVTEDYREDIRAQGLNPDLRFNDRTLPVFERSRLAEAQRRLHRNLALEAVAKAEQLAVPETELDQQVESLAKRFRAGRKARKVNTAKLRAFLKERLLREKALAWLEDHNTFKVRNASAGAAGEETGSSPTGPANLTESTPDTDLTPT